MFRVHFLVFLVGRLVSVCALPHSCTPCFAFLPTALARRCISISNPFFPCLLSCFACIVQEQADFLAASDCKRQQARYCKCKVQQSIDSVFFACASVRCA